MAAKFFVKHLRLDESELPSCDRTPPLTPKTPVPKTPKTPGSPFDLNVNYFCFRKGRSRLSAKMNGTIGPARSVIYQPEGHPKQAVIDGEIWPPIFKPRHVRSAKKMNVEDGDIFIATYPKCGTTWLQHICHQLVRGEQYHPGAGNEMCIQSPMIERMGAQFAGTVMRPRILKTHFTHQNMPWSPKGKYIFCVRNPKDCLTSYYHHNRNFKIYNWAQGDFDTFFDLFLNGQLAFGDYFEHLSTWLPHLEKDNVLFLKYEDMVADLKGCIRQIGEFIGGRAGDIVEDEIRLARIAANSTIDAMKKDQQRWFPEKQLHKSEFIRKGGSRDWKNHLTKEQSDRLDSVWASKMAGTVAEHWWRFEMSWEDAPLSLLAHLNLEDDDMESVSRRGSFSTFDKEHGHLSRFGGADRRCSYTSLISAGYGSVWSLNH